MEKNKWDELNEMYDDRQNAHGSSRQLVRREEANVISESNVLAQENPVAIIPAAKKASVTTFIDRVKATRKITKKTMEIQGSGWKYNVETQLRIYKKKIDLALEHEEQRLELLRLQNLQELNLGSFRRQIEALKDLSYMCAEYLEQAQNADLPEFMRTEWLNLVMARYDGITEKIRQTVADTPYTIEPQSS